MNQTLKSKLTFSKKSVFWLHRRSSHNSNVFHIMQWRPMVIPDIFIDHHVMIN